MDLTISRLETLKFECKFCNKSFSRESSLLAHVCERKRRFLQREDRGVQLGLRAYQKFFELTQSSAKLKTFQEFEDSQYYLAFVRFGRYLIDINAIEPDKFTEWLIKNAVKLDKWTSDTSYQAYVLNAIKYESSEIALERSIKNMDVWAQEESRSLESFFENVSSIRAVNMIHNARISPWIIFNCESGVRMLEQFTDEQLTIIEKVIDPSFWQKKFKDYPADVELVKHILQEAGIK